MSIVNIRLQSSIVLYDALHDFRQGRGIGAAIMETKLEQKLAGIVHEPLLQVFIDCLSRILPQRILHRRILG